MRNQRRTKALPSADEHTALLNDGSAFESLRRVDNLFDQGVATVFGIRQGEADLHAFYFCAWQFTPAAARRWLRERGFTAALFLEATEPIGA
jgi:hypothetical protein